MRSPIRPMLHRMRCKNGRFIEYWPGDEFYAASLHFNWRWRGEWWWLVIFFF